MPLIKGYKSTSITHAFILNSLVATITVMVAVMVKDQLQTKYKDDKGVEYKKDFTLKDIAITSLITFTTTLLGLTAMYLLFGFGCGMLCLSKSE